MVEEYGTGLLRSKCTQIVQPLKEVMLNACNGYYTMRDTTELRAVWEIVEYVKERLDATKSDNISVYLPQVNKLAMKQLQKCFSAVEHGAFGYVEFRR